MVMNICKTQGRNTNGHEHLQNSSLPLEIEEKMSYNTEI